MIDLAWLWDDRLDANVSLILGKDPGLHLSSHITRIRLHSVIIASTSEYFKKCLQTEVGKIKDRSCSPSYADALLGYDCKYEIHDMVEEAAVPAALAVLETMYKQALPTEDPSVALLLSMLQVIGVNAA